VSIPFVRTFDFTPNLGQWTPIGNIASVARSGNVFTLALQSGGRTLQVSFLSATCFRVRFNPAPGADYSIETSIAVVNRSLGAVSLTVTQNDQQALVVDTGSIVVHIDLQPYRVRVFRNGQLISADEPAYNLVYIPGAMVIANFKTRQDSARHFGFGEKAGSQLVKTLLTMTQFNYDNFNYVNAPLPQPGRGGDNNGGPLNPSEALYTSIPFLLEINRNPSGVFQGDPYTHGIFFDNPAQSYFNMGSNDYSNMNGKYYFGALFGDLDYYFFYGNNAVDVLGQYTALTGRSPMPPKYVFGFHQGAYGYFSRQLLEQAANKYRNFRIPCDGLHIDVDFQNNYRTFTHSEMKFPNAAQMMAGLHAKGFKCSTNITPLLTTNAFDENAQMGPYVQRQALLNMDTFTGLIFNARAGRGPNPELFEGRVSYGSNFGTNPFPYPGLISPNALGAIGNYPDLGRADVRDVWGQQYTHLVKTLGMDMIWQDMTCPAMVDQGDTPGTEVKTFPLDLMVNDGVTYVPNAVYHNAYALFLLKATWDGLAKLRPDTRNFIIARGGYAGMQRYAALWTGDSGSSWDFLRINLPEVLNLGLSGVPITGCDIGGFANNSGCVGYANGASGDGSQQPFVVNGKIQGGVCNYELLTRWMQLGSFLPWYRNHYNGYTKEFQEPYAYGEPVPTHCRKYVELRYRMLQIYYDAMYEWTQNGMPIARALFLNDPADPEVYNHLDDQFFVGRDFLVAPILFPAETASPPAAPVRSIYLPAKSAWYAFKDNQAKLDPPVPGGQTVANFFAGLDLVPVYVRAGAILPMRSNLEQYVGELRQNPLDINIYPGPDADYLMYQDDGISTLAQSKSAFRTTRIRHRAVPGGTRVQLTRETDQFAPAEVFYTVRLLATPKPSSVTAGGAPVPDAGSAAALANAAGNAYFWDPNLESAVVKVFDKASDETITVLF
jgi:alpha-glucosidase